MLSEKDIRNNIDDFKKVVGAIKESYGGLAAYLNKAEQQEEKVLYAFQKYFDRKMMPNLDDQSRIDELMKNGVVPFNQEEYDLDTIRELANLKANYPLKGDARGLYVQYRQIPELLKASEPVLKSGLSYMLVSSDDKEAGVEAINELANILKQDFIKLVKRYTNVISIQDPLQDYLKNYDWYFELLNKMTGGRIQRESDPEYVSPAEFSETINILKNISNEKKNAAANVKAVVDKIINGYTSIALKDVDVEELNADKSGFKVSLLKNNGINNMAEVIRKAKRGGLSYIQGISPEESTRILDKAIAIGKMYAKNISIKIDPDDRNDLASELIGSVYEYRNAKKKENDLKGISSVDVSSLIDSIGLINPLKSKCDWFVSNHLQKVKAVETYKQIMGNEALSLIRKYDNKETGVVNSEEHWKDYTANAAEYYALLDEVTPGIFSKDEGSYGLPAELAQEIASQEVNLGQLKATLRPYQEYGVKYVLKQKRVLLGDEMGLGKTVQAIASMVSIAANGGSHFLVVAPASVLINWCKEIDKFSNLRPVRLHGSDRYYNYRDWEANGGVAVTTFETMSKFEVPKTLKIDMMVVDEAHYVKNRNALRTKTVLSLKDQCEHILFMTGTALENNVEEMLSLIDVLQPEIAKQANRMTSLKKAQQFRDAVAGVYFRRRREDVLQELPELIESDQWCEMTKTDKKAYRTGVFSRHFMGMRQVSWNVENIAESSKANRLLELCDQARDEGRKVIVFSFFSNTLAKVREILGDRATEVINGSLPPIKRQEIIDDFTKAEEGKVLVSQIQAGGTGLNIQAASVVIFCEPQVKPSLETQAISRAYRLGQTRSVLVYRLLCENSVDKEMLERLAEKQTLFDNFADESVAGFESLEINSDDINAIMDKEAAALQKEDESDDAIEEEKNKL